MRQPKTGGRRLATICALAAAAAALAGCVDTAVEVGARRPGPTAARHKPVPRPGVSPHGASVALASLEGAPEEILTRFRPLFVRTAEVRDIATAGEADAAYKLRGYLTAYAGPEGATRLGYVFDVFDHDGRRAQRLADEVVARGAGDPWSALGDQELAEFAARGADDLAAFLSNTPEALAAAGGEPGVTVATATHSEPLAAASKPLGFAEAK
ncbi:MULTISPECIES: hypothetical protein [Methylosinus]|uniref:Uncharacterized protein n=1 Tax=Methylosinus trichosporium (strain ATCC 35070 / NCIMB 11131 / UNIQEM 75 / OB3b) TaxID=595536 RepID=A0A2D2CW44_METT3|nr:MULTISPECIES: hypothetical protein [Methylosinus]ATQ67001.1 hypothetical protein CQW49_03210 [Methylosinus trichosporium OB3b]OBS54523.1 hypothetical protein A8B73_00165 [Methylosinus sp. 3S-1]